MERQAGYSLVELLVVLAVLGILASMVMPLAEVTRQRAKETELKRNLWQLRDAIDAYAQARRSGALQPDPTSGATSMYPPDLATLTLPLADQRIEHRGEVLRFLRSVPRDPFADPSLPAEKTWGLRSYASEAARPLAGEDVYDVHSLSPKLGLNGTALKTW